MLKSDPIVTTKDTVPGYVYLVAIVAALGGLLFGFDTAVINGAIILLRKEFALTDFQTELAAGSLLIGCALGASSGGTLSDRFGRRKLLLLSGTLFLLSAIGAAIPRNLTEFILARLVGGLAIGVASAISPLYIAEMSPSRIRGRLVTLNQLAIVLGILAAFVVNWTLAGLGQSSWRWMFLAAALPALVFVLSLIFVAESPRWLVQQGRPQEALAVLRRLAGPEDAEVLMTDIRSAIAQESHGSISALFRRPLRRPMFIAIALAVFSQITGINTILYYGSLIFTEHSHGTSASSALLANVVIGGINLAGTIVAIVFLDRAGRRPLLMAAAAGMSGALAVLVFGFRMQPVPMALVLGAILFYVASFASGLGPGSWLVMSELLPTSVRGRAMAVATVCLWLACLLITMTFLSLVSFFGTSATFAIYGVLCVAALLFFWKMIPETKGRSLEEIELQWTREPSR